MKLHIEESVAFDEVKITIQCPFVDAGLRGLIERISRSCRQEQQTEPARRICKHGTGW